MFSVVLLMGETNPCSLCLLQEEELGRKVLAGLAHPCYTLVTVLMTLQMQHSQYGLLFREKKSFHC